MYVQNMNQSQSKNLTPLPKRIRIFSLRKFEVPAIERVSKNGLNGALWNGALKVTRNWMNKTEI